MPQPYSADLRERALAACEGREGSRAGIARRFAVGVLTLHDWRRQARQEGRRVAKPARGGRPLLGGDEAWVALERVLAEGDDATLLAELADELAARGLALHRSPSDITVDDLVATLSTTVRRASEVPPFELEP